MRPLRAWGARCISAPSHTPFTDTSDPEAGKAWALGLTAGTSATTFSPSQPISREQAATMLSAVYRKLGGSIEGASASFADDSSISSWAKSSVYFMARHGIIVVPEATGSPPSAAPSVNPASLWPCACPRRCKPPVEH